MTNIVAGPGYLQIGDTRFSLPRKHEYVSGLYEGGGPTEFFTKAAERMGRERGFEFDDDNTAIDTGNMVTFWRGSERVGSIPIREIEETLPYAKFLRVVEPDRDSCAHKVVLSLERKINALGLDALQALKATIPSGALRGPRDDIIVGIEIAIGSSYEVHITY